MVSLAATNSPARDIAAMERPGERPDEDTLEELTDEEKARFVGVEWRTVQFDGTNLVMAIELSKPMAEAVSASMYAFGYRADVPFDRMPKIHVKLGILDHGVFDQNRKLSDSVVTVTRKAREISVKIPVENLNSPSRVFTSARTYLADVPLDWASWRIIELPKGK